MASTEPVRISQMTVSTDPSSPYILYIPTQVNYSAESGGSDGSSEGETLPTLYATLFPSSPPALFWLHCIVLNLDRVRSQALDGCGAADGAAGGNSDPCHVYLRAPLRVLSAHMILVHNYSTCVYALQKPIRSDVVIESVPSSVEFQPMSNRQARRCLHTACSALRGRHCGVCVACVAV